MTTRICTNIEAVRANGEFTGWRTQHFPPSSTLSSRQSGRKFFCSFLAIRFLDVILALPELLFWVTGLRPLQAGFSLEGCPLQRAGQTPTKLPSVLGSSFFLSFLCILLCASYFSPSKRLSCLILDLRTRGGGGRITLVVPTSPRRLPKSPPRHLPSVPGKKPRQKPWARRSSFSKRDNVSSSR